MSYRGNPGKTQGTSFWLECGHPVTAIQYELHIKFPCNHLKATSFSCLPSLSVNNFKLAPFYWKRNYFERSGIKHAKHCCADSL